MAPLLGGPRSSGPRFIEPPEPPVPMPLNACLLLNSQVQHHSINNCACVMLVVTEGKASLIFASPEAVLGGQWAVKAMKSYRQRICLLALDEIHCLSEW